MAIGATMMHGVEVPHGRQWDNCPEAVEMLTEVRPEGYPELCLPHVGWLAHEPGDAVAVYLNQGWFEFKEQAFTWLYLRPGDTVVDCGSHFGLYAVLAGHVIGTGSVLAIEPNPTTAALLETNLKRHGTPGARLIRKCVCDASGERSFYAAGDGKAAYGSLMAPQEIAEPITVTATTLDELLAEQGLACVDFTKIDVEGAEIEVLRGATQSIADGRLALVMMEFTEQNLLRAGSSSRALFEMAEAAGYGVSRFDAGSRRLEPCSYEGPIWYENLFLTREPEAVNKRLRSASPEHQRIAYEILERGNAAAELYHRAEEAKLRIAEAQAGAEKAYRQLGEANWLVGETRREGEETRRKLEETREELEGARRELEGTRSESHRLLAELASNVHPYLSSFYMRLGWKSGLIHRPDWLIRFVEDQRKAASE